MKARAVIGANFGDEGKGLTVDWLCKQGADVVVRFNGGAQSGHTVVTEHGERHVFGHFGSGHLRSVPTFLSQFFVCNPILFFKEQEKLVKLGYRPLVFAHPDCLVTTFADMMINQSKETARGGNRHGSCGVGFHETQNRSKISHLKITMADLWNGGKRLPQQLEEICDKYAEFRTGKAIPHPEEAIEKFIKGCDEFAEHVHPAGIEQCKNIVFEGGQGLLLDENNKAYFPHLTHSSTGMKNIRMLCGQAGIDDIEIYYVSRSYLTRHGAGPLPGEDPTMSYKDDTNLEHPFQGKLRFAPLDSKLKTRCYNDAGDFDWKLVLTHCDQYKRQPPIEADFYSYGPTQEDLTLDFAVAV